MFKQMGKMMEMAKQAKRVQKKLRKTKITAETEGGAIEVVMNGEMTVEQIQISPELLTENNKEQIEKGLKNALNQAHKKAQQVAAQESKELMGGLGI
jgi:nucleoid-associated protein EbfC